MTTFEIILIVGLIISPILALIILAPKIKKNAKDKQVQPKPKMEEDKKPAENYDKPFANTGYSTNEFKDYLKKGRNTEPADEPKEKQEHNPFEPDFKIPDFDLDFDFDKPKSFEKKEKPESIDEEIDNLSPELKAMLLTGVLQRKDFDDDDNHG